MWIVLREGCIEIYNIVIALVRKAGGGLRDRARKGWKEGKGGQRILCEKGRLGLRYDLCSQKKMIEYKKQSRRRRAA